MRRLTALLTLVALSAGCTSGFGPKEPPASTSTTSSPEVRNDDAPVASFSACSEESLGGFECASVEAPLDYANPTGRSIKVAVARARATKSRRGVLFINPGGPGASGREFLSYALSFISSDVKASFDIIAVDPRGTGGTLPLDCAVNLDGVFALDPSPETSDEIEAIIAADTQFADACSTAGKEFLAHVSTANTARDMDRVRRALGVSTIDYMGFSYGTALGASFIALFPESVGRFILDGPVDVTLPLQERTLQQGEGFERALEKFFTWCERTSCSMAPRTEARFDALMQRLDTAPLANTNGRPASNLAVGLFATAVALYSTDTYDTLAGALTSAERGDGSVLLRLYDAYMERSPDGRFGTTQYGFRAISAADDAPLSVEEQEEMLVQAKRRLPRWWPLFSVQPHADPWMPFEREQRIAFTAAPAGSTLVVAATDDPATPFSGGEALAGLLRAPLLVRNGADHTSYASSSCVKSKVDAFLLEGSLPNHRETCD